MLEIELKFPVSRVDLIHERLRAWGATPVPPVVQIDRYFAHPARDFAQTDEAFRMRTIGTENFVTYKGPVLDRQVKTRREIEIPIGPGAECAAQFQEMLTALAFREVRTVEKRRSAWRFSDAGRSFELSLDDVVDLGLYLELETLAEPDHQTEAQTAIQNLAQQLHLGQPERHSYLALLLSKSPSPPAP